MKIPLVGQALRAFRAGSWSQIHPLGLLHGAFKLARLKAGSNMRMRLSFRFALDVLTETSRRTLKTPKAFPRLKYA